MCCADPTPQKGQQGRERRKPTYELRLISRDSASGGYRFEIGAQSTLPPQILYYAIAQYSAQNRAGHRTWMKFLDHGSPASVFKLDENSMLNVRAASDATGGALSGETGRSAIK